VQVGDLVMLSFDALDRQGYDDYGANMTRKEFGLGVILSKEGKEDKWGNTYNVFYSNKGKSYKYSESFIEVIDENR